MSPVIYFVLRLPKTDIIAPKVQGMHSNSNK